MKNNLAQPTISFRQKIILIICGIFFCAILLEVGLRIGGFIFSSLQEYRNITSIKKKGAYRIICLGESTTALGGKDSYPSQLEDILNQRNTGIKFSVINKGIPATNTDVIVSLLQDNLDKYNPDMVITMMGLNDGGDFVFYEDISAPKTKTFFTSFRTYKLARLLWLHIAAKAKEMGFYKPKEGVRGVGLEGHYVRQINSSRLEEVLRKIEELNIKDDKRYVELGWYYKNQGKFAQAGEMFKKAIELNPTHYRAYAGLAQVYLELGKYSQMVESLEKAIELDLQAEGMEPHLSLAKFSVYRMEYTQAEEILKKAIELRPEDSSGYFQLGWCYKKQRKFTQAEEMFKKVIELVPQSDRGYGALAILYKEIDKDESAKEYYKKANKLRSERFNPVTRQNYLKLHEILDKRNVNLVCVQYCVRSVEPLKKIFEGRDGVIFVDNEKVFKDALEKTSYEEYFNDMMGGDFGHCAPKGNRLLAENIANVILKERFNIQF